MMSAKLAIDLEPYRECHLCPRECGANRLDGDASHCGETAVCRIGAAEPHFGEEPSFTGTGGSGTIFFSGCSSCCFFCQNYQLSRDGLGREVTPEQLVETGMELAAKGVHNINFVSPDHFWPHVKAVTGELRARGVDIPFLFNCSGYEKEAMVADYAEAIDIFMPDFKYADPEVARTSMGDPRYPEIARKAIAKMIELKGFLDPWDPTGKETARQGVLVRHLVLPGYVDNSLSVLKLLRKEFGRLLPISVMSQFKPVPACEVEGDMTRELQPEEFAQVSRAVEDLGFEHAYVQELRSSEDFLPDFEQLEPFRGNAERS